MFHRHVDHSQRESLREFGAIALRSTRAKQQHLATSHEHRPDKLVGASLLVIAVDEHESRAHAKQCTARRLSVSTEMRHVASDFNSGSQQRSGQRIGRKNQYGVVAHVVGREEDRGSVESSGMPQLEDQSPIPSTDSPLDARGTVINIRRGDAAVSFLFARPPRVPPFRRGA